MTKKSRITALFALTVGCLTFVRTAQAVTDKVWTGAAGGDWNTAGNWDPAGVPTADDAVVFNGDAQVAIAAGVTNAVWCIKVNAGAVTLTGGADARLDMTSNTPGNDKNGWNVQKGAKLDLRVATWCENRTDKWYGGELWFHAPLRLKNTSYFGYGTNCFAQGANVYCDKFFTVGLGMSETGLRDCVIFTDDAVLNAAQVRFTGSDSCTTNYLEISGNATVDCNNLIINPSSTAADQYLLLKGGTLKVNALFQTELSGVKPGHFLQTGGTLITVKPVDCTTGTFRQEGGVYDCRCGMTFRNGTYFDFAGGEFHLTHLSTSSNKDFYLEDWLHVSGDEAVFSIPANGTMHWNFDRAVIGAETKIVKKGAGNLVFDKSQTVTRALAVRGGPATVASGVTLTAPDGSDAAWSLEIGDGAEVRLTDITSRLSLPIDLTVSGTGKFAFANGSPAARGLVIARSAVTNGVALAPGRYLGGTVVSGLTGSSLVVPYRWSGRGDGVSFADAANWYGDAVPPSATTTPVDLSAATRVAIDGDYALTSVVYLPAGSSRTATLAVTGTLTLDSAEWFSCAVYVKEGARLALDMAKFSRGTTDKGDMSVLGGGTVAMKGDFPSILWTNGDLIYVPLSIDGTLALNGATTVYKCDQCPYDFRFLSLWSHEVQGRGSLLIEEGADVAANRLFMCANRFSGLAEVRQTGGTATFGDVYLEKVTDDAHVIEYVLEGGTLNVTNGLFGLSRVYSGAINPLRRPGPSFRMTGGTLNVPQGFGVDGNQNRVRLSGGTVYGGGTWKIAMTGTDYAVTNRNTDGFYFGGVELANAPGQTLNIRDDVVLTGEGGDTVVNAGVSMGYWKSGTKEIHFTGPGGLVLKGSTTTVSVDGNLEFTGGITVNASYYAYIGNNTAGETFNGPRFIKVTDPNCNVIVRCKILKDPDVVSLPVGHKFRFMGSGYALNHAMHVKRFILGGVDQPVGTYAITGGSIVVDDPAASWVEDGAGDLTYLGDSTVTEAVTLTSLAYRPFEKDVDATLSGTAAVTLADGATVDVAEGRTLTVSAPVILAGTVRKTGLGRVVFAGSVTSVDTPSAGTGLADRIVVELGEADFAGAVTGVGVYTCNADGRTAAAVFTNGCTVSDHAFFRTAWTDDSSVKNVTGETRVDGGTVDLSDSPLLSDALVLTKPNGGRGRLVVNSGTLAFPSGTTVHSAETAAEKAAFEIVQNGGTLTVGGDWNVLAPQADTATFALNGGTLDFAESRDLFLPSSGGIRATLGGTAALTQTAADVDVVLADAWGGAGTLVQKGAGSVTFRCALPLQGLGIEAGTAVLGPAAGAALADDCELTVASGGTLGLADDALAVVNHATFAGIECAAGDYRPGTGPARVRKALAGLGTLRVKTGNGPGLKFILR